MIQQSKKTFSELVKTNDRPILADGAMGTMLNARGIGFQECFDYLNLSNPTLVAEIHQEYIDAGAQIILTNTFGANHYKLSEHGLGNSVVEINQAGVELAREAALAPHDPIMVAGDIGPLGVRLAPYGRIRPDQAINAYIEQISALVKAGVDLLVIETITDLVEMQVAVAAVQQVCDLPVVASMSYTRDDLTLLGDSPGKVAKTLWESGVDVIGVNCSGGPSQILRILTWMSTAVPNAPFSAMPNAGWPEHISGRIMYPAGPDYFAEYIHQYHDSGVILTGGCCGTTPAHIAAMREILDNWSQTSIKQQVSISIPDRVISDEPRISLSQLESKVQEGKFVISVEMDPPRGLSTHKLLAGASMLTEAGADVINVADSPMARMRMSPWAVCNIIQRELNTDTTLHFPVRGRNLLRIQGDLLAAHALGIHNVFVVMGDPTEIGDYPDAMDDYDLVPSGLIRLIKQRFNIGIDHAGNEIGQPTSFFVGCALNLTPRDPEREIKNLRRKLKAGADFILTQPVYRPGEAASLLSHFKELHGEIGVPVLVGLLPLLNARHAAFLHHEVPGIDIPVYIRERISSAGDKAEQEGVDIALELVDQIKNWGDGIYLMPAFNKYDIAADIIEGICCL